MQLNQGHFQTESHFSNLESAAWDLSNLNICEDIYMDDINALDFELIKLKLQDKLDGEGWSLEKCHETELAYKRFLALKRAFKNKALVPHDSIDTFWRQHILDTKKYANDCENIFGYFLHHYLYFGMNGKQDAQDIEDAFEETKLLYKRHFGENYMGAIFKSSVLRLHFGADHRGKED